MSSAMPDDGAGHDVGEHSDSVKRVVERVVAAHNKVCEHDRDDDDDRKGDDAHDERVARGKHRAFSSVRSGS